MWCDHCNRHGHTREICWQIHGKPANWVSRRQSEGRNGRLTDSRASQSNGDKAGAAPPVGFSPHFSKEQIEHLCRLLNQSSPQISSSSSANLGTCSHAQSGKFHSALNFSASPEPWIIVSGASDHMTGYHRGGRLAVLGFMTDFISLKILIKRVDKLSCRGLPLSLFLVLEKLCYCTINLVIPTLLI